MRNAPDEWSSRVFEALLQVGRSFSRGAWDETTTEVLIRMRIGSFAATNKNLFQRYCSTVFRCHICNHVLDDAEGIQEEARAKHTVAHLQLHRDQVMGVLAPESIYADSSWDYTNTPSSEEVERVHTDLSNRHTNYLDSFTIVRKEWRR